MRIGTVHSLYDSHMTFNIRSTLFSETLQNAKLRTTKYTLVPCKKNCYQVHDINVSLSTAIHYEKQLYTKEFLTPSPSLFYLKHNRQSTFSCLPFHQQLYIIEISQIVIILLITLSIIYTLKHSYTTILTATACTCICNCNCIK